MNTEIQRQLALPVTVATYDVGLGDRMHLSAVLRYQQEAAEQHLAPGDLGWSGLWRQGMAFVCSRWHEQILRFPGMGERLTLTTWHRERKGARFYRCYTWQDARGEEILRGVMEFALVDVVDHHLLRGTEFDAFGVPDNRDHGVDCADPGRLILPPLTAAGEYTVRHSDADRNGHMNNTHYADLCTDFLPPALAGRQVTDVQLHFSGETRPGDRLCMSCGQQGEIAFVQGQTERGKAFVARLEFAPEDENG